MCLSLSQMILFRQSAWLRNSSRYLFLHLENGLILDKLVGLQHQKVPTPDLSFQLMYPEQTLALLACLVVKSRQKGRRKLMMVFSCQDALAESFLVCRAVRMKLWSTGLWLCLIKRPWHPVRKCKHHVLEHAGRQHCRVATWASALPLQPP